jgi:hypothetical protein
MRIGDGRHPHVSGLQVDPLVTDIDFAACQPRSMSAPCTTGSLIDSAADSVALQLPRSA